MNQNIYDLMLEAGYDAPHLAARAHKLVKLIVKECANIASDNDALYICEDIREHFGVE